jgi:hypothetical protein
LKDPKNRMALGALAWSLSAVAARVEAREAAVIAAQAATILVQAMKNIKGPNALGEPTDLSASYWRSVRQRWHPFWNPEMPRRPLPPLFRPSRLPRNHSSRSSWHGV